MASDTDRLPAFFEDDFFDPVKTATGTGRKPSGEAVISTPADQPKISPPSELPHTEKKKAGFYLSVRLLERFTRKFHELKLAGVNIENKSALIEAALSFALDDIDRGASSSVLQEIQGRGLSG